MAISIGINSFVWISPFTTKSIGLIDKAGKMGFDVFEFAIEDASHVDVKKIGDKLKSAGLRSVICGAYGPSRDLTHDEEKYRQESIDYTHSLMKIAEQWGTKIVAGPMYSAVGKRRQVSDAQKKREWDRAVKGLRKVAKLAGNYGVTLGIEPLNRFETDLINTSEQAVRLVKDIGEKNVGVHLDTFHMAIEEKCPYEAIKHAGKHLVHMHTCENDRGTPGSGQVHWDYVAKGLKDVKFDGICSIESFTPECKAIAAAAAIWRPLCSSQDKLAKDGLGFLRKLFN